MGLGRENITGVLPVYLFKEHWDIARRKAPPVYGFMCTLDIMGYASSQYFTVPYLVLLKAIEKADTEQKEIFKQIKDMVLETCKSMMGFNEEHRRQVIEMVTNFISKPEARTADVVPSIPVLLAQLYVLTELDNYHQYLGSSTESQLDLAKMQTFIRFAFEEHIRRCLKDGSQPLEKAQILNMLYPDYNIAVNEVMAIKEKEIVHEFSGGKDQNSSTDKLLKYKGLADTLRSRDAKRAPS